MDLPITDGKTCCGGKRPNILEEPDNWFDIFGHWAFIDEEVKMEKPPSPDTLPTILREGDPGVWTSCPKDPEYE